MAKNRIVIVVEQGSVTVLMSEEPISVEIFDLDNLEHSADVANDWDDKFYNDLLKDTGEMKN